ncbi:MAG: class II aldolase/adducin family protein, partial [Coriobacteriia bacterium]|nr:class II aldolase/adducin family protein [Coriobacteriia bacterium]
LAADERASIELVVHRALYHGVPGTRAVVHAHSLFTTLLSLKQDSIEPLDSESKHFIPCVPVLDVKETIASAEVAELLPQLMRDTDCPVAVIKGHGPFAVGKDLDEAWRYISILEMSSRMIHLFNQ